MSGATGSIASFSLKSIDYAEKFYAASRKLIGQGSTSTSSSSDSNYTRYSITSSMHMHFISKSRQMTMLNQATVLFWLGEYERAKTAFSLLQKNSTNTDVIDACSIMLALTGNVSLPSNMFPLTIHLFKINAVLYLNNGDLSALLKLCFCPDAPFLNTVVNEALLTSSKKDSGRRQKKLHAYITAKGLMQYPLRMDFKCLRIGDNRVLEYLLPHDSQAVEYIDTDVEWSESLMNLIYQTRCEHISFDMKRQVGIDHANTKLVYWYHTESSTWVPFQRTKNVTTVPLGALIRVQIAFRNERNFRISLNEIKLSTMDGMEVVCENMILEPMTISYAYFDLTPEKEAFFKLSSLEFRLNGIKGHLSLLFRGGVNLGKRSDKITCSPNPALCFQTRCMEVSCHVKELLPESVRQGQVLRLSIHNYKHAKVSKHLDRIGDGGTFEIWISEDAKGILEVPIHDQVILFCVKTPLLQIQEAHFTKIKLMAHEELSITSIAVTRHSKISVYRAPEHAACVLPEGIPVTIDLELVDLSHDIGVPTQHPTFAPEREGHSFAVTTNLEDGTIFRLFWHRRRNDLDFFS